MAPAQAEEKTAVVDPMNATIPPGVCGDGQIGWNGTVPIKLKNGKGMGTNPDGSFADVSVIDSREIGRADVDGDGETELVMALQCSGSHPDYCCAGQASLLWFTAVFDGSTQPILRLKAPVIRGTKAGPGDETGPAERSIDENTRLEGNAIVTTESILYADQYSSQQVGGDPYRSVTVTYRLRNGSWDEQIQR